MLKRFATKWKTCLLWKRLIETKKLPILKRLFFGLTYPLENVNYFDNFHSFSRELLQIEFYLLHFCSIFAWLNIIMDLYFFSFCTTHSSAVLREHQRFFMRYLLIWVRKLVWKTKFTETFKRLLNGSSSRVQQSAFYHALTNELRQFSRESFSICMSGIRSLPKRQIIKIVCWQSWIH